MLFIIGTLYDSDAHVPPAVASVPPVYTTSQLDEGILCVFALGKLGYGKVILFL